MNKSKKLELENKVLKEQLEEFCKEVPIVYYDKEPTIWNYSSLFLLYRRFIGGRLSV